MSKEKQIVKIDWKRAKFVGIGILIGISILIFIIIKIKKIT